MYSPVSSDDIGCLYFTRNNNIVVISAIRDTRLGPIAECYNFLNPKEVSSVFVSTGKGSAIHTTKLGIDLMYPTKVKIPQTSN